MVRTALVNTTAYLLTAGGFVSLALVSVSGIVFLANVLYQLIF